jgi:tRNA threonylcarbamoyladenosine biosynthesis protein TsaB
VLDTEDGRAAVRQKTVTTHSEMLLPLISECLKELGYSPKDLSGVACGSGPGSFTGLRMGICTAKGLCFALGLPLVLVSSLEALAMRGQTEQELTALPARTAPSVLAVLDAFRGRVFARLEVAPGVRTKATQEVLASHPRLADDAVWTPESLALAVAPLAKELTLCGGGLHRYPAAFRAVLSACQRCADGEAPHPLDVARLGSARLSSGLKVPLYSAVPNYLCASAAEEAGTA